MTVSISGLSYYNTSASATSSSSTSTSTSDSSGFSIEDFLSLLITELKSQDPSNPMSTSDMVNQEVQMQTITQMAKMTSSIEQMTTATQETTATSMIGKMVIYSDSTTGSSVAAQVEALQYTSASGVILELASGTEIPITDVSYVYDRTDEATTISTSQKLSATSYLGKTVTYTSSSGSSMEGVVESLLFTGTSVYLNMGTTTGSSISLDDVTNVDGGGTTSSSQKLSATTYLGKTITYTDTTSGSSTQGTVDSIIFDGSDIYFDLGTTSGSSIPLSDVTNVSNGS
jgi:flagellar hook assembly protein FlgD